MQKPYLCKYMCSWKEREYTDYSGYRTGITVCDVRDLKTGDFPLSEEAYLTLKEDMLALAITVVDILNGAAYLFDQKPTVNNKHWKSDLELEDFRNSLGLATKSKSNC